MSDDDHVEEIDRGDTPPVPLQETGDEENASASDLVDLLDHHRTLTRKRPKFGTRYLKDESKIFECNAWDHVEWTEERLAEIKEKIAKNSANKATPEEEEELERLAAEKWNAFYSKHEHRFFKDRHWLFTEFPELADKDSALKVLEVGCGAGNTVFPLLKANTNPNLFVYACDYSSEAVKVVRTSDHYEEARCSAFVADLSKPDMIDGTPLEPESLDIIVCIFVVSALRPDTFETAASNLSRLLKPGGIILYRDYGRYDLTQVRFKEGRCLGENFYKRGDDTRVYFFTKEEVTELMMHHGLNEEYSRYDKRLLVNRSKKLTMYRNWIQAKYRKPAL
eukprot:Clim_evm20s7 gene=Clim_evmTU20s7